ncbi:3863_t:CDS:2 [Funneliformis geosporum]|uniref:3863_t:CDS:1 n=1 Tax=Funneliformis geosporum TaxID=1117311 RepID=A0A9W4T386_9GLOM|nr:3863_t:CDS:2 [Funneliformis geosporum]
MTTDFLQEIVNHKLVDDYKGVVKFYGISRDPQTNNYIIAIDYKEGLGSIHQQGLIHRDFHSGNILNINNSVQCYITDLGLSRPANYQLEEGQIFGVLPYVAPEALQGYPYTQASDIYSFGIVAYELLANAYPYPKMEDIDLALKVCEGYRPNIDELKIPQLLKDLVKRCKVTPFAQQYQKVKDDFDVFYRIYQIYPTAITTSKMIDTKEITQKLQSYQASKDLELDINNFDELNLQEECAKQSSKATGISKHYVRKRQSTDLAIKSKRQLSLESQTKTAQEKTKLIKATKEPEYQSEPMEIDHPLDN